MIDNSDKIGHFTVALYGHIRQVAHFQTPTMEDAIQEAKNLAKTRCEQGKYTGRAEIHPIVGKDASLVLGPGGMISGKYLLGSFLEKQFKIRFFQQLKDKGYDYSDKSDS
jgi:hypothetical protein